MWFERHAWVVLLASTLLYVPQLWRRARPHITAHPELEPGYRRLIWGIVLWLCLPWLVMGVGDLVVGIPSFLRYFRPAGGEPFIWVFWVVAFVWTAVTGYWGIRGGGAEVLVRYPGLLDFRTDSVRRVKWYFAGLAVFGFAINTAVLVVANR